MVFTADPQETVVEIGAVFAASALPGDEADRWWRDIRQGVDDEPDDPWTRRSEQRR